MQAQLATRLNKKIKDAVVSHCKVHGIKISKFIEDALLDRLEELEDTSELESLRREPRRRFETFVADLKRRGRL